MAAFMRCGCRGRRTCLRCRLRTRLRCRLCGLRTGLWHWLWPSLRCRLLRGLRASLWRCLLRGLRAGLRRFTRLHLLLRDRRSALRLDRRLRHLLRSPLTGSLARSLSRLRRVDPPLILPRPLRLHLRCWLVWLADRLVHLRLRWLLLLPLHWPL